MFLPFGNKAGIQGINFQGVARSANGTIIAASNISLRLSIIAKSVDATPEYVETKTVVTNTQGIFSIVVGDASNNTITGNFKNINWADAPKFLKVEMDPAGVTNFISMGATQLQYVPYSFYSLGVAAANVNGILPLAKGGTGVGSIGELKTALGNYGNVDSIGNIKVGNNVLAKTQKTPATFFTSMNKNNVNIGIGDSALFSNTIGAYNIAIGNKSLAYNKVGGFNTSVGYGAMLDMGNDTSTWQGWANTAVGSTALMRNRNGSGNIAMGSGTLELGTTGNMNAGYGMDALHFANGDNNTGMGDSALSYLNTGNNNTGIGYRSGLGLINGSNNIFIGNSVGANSTFANVSNVLAIDNKDTTKPLIYGEFNNKKLTINGDLYVKNTKLLGEESIINSLNNRIDSLVQIIRVLTTQVSDPLKNVWVKFNFDPAVYNFGSNSSYDDSTSKLYMFNTGSTKLKIVDFRNGTTDSITIVSPITDLSILTVDRNSGKLYGRSGYGKDKVYQFNFTSRAWELKVNGLRDWETFGATDFYNGVDNKVGLFGGYGYFATKNWIYEADITSNTTTAWTNTYSNRDNSLTTGIAKATGKKVTYNRNRTKLYLSGGQGNYSGDQFSNACTTSSITWATDVGKYCWLNDLWEYDLTTKAFTNIIPLSNSTYPTEGLTAFDYDNDVLYLMGGRTPMATYNPSADSASTYGMKLYKFPLNNNPNKIFTEVQTNTAALPAYHSVGVMGDPRLYYDGRLKSLIWITVKGIFTIKL
jgi:hypothetical protein